MGQTCWTHHIVLAGSFDLLMTSLLAAVQLWKLLVSWCKEGILHAMAFAGAGLSQASMHHLGQACINTGSLQNLKGVVCRHYILYY